MRLPLRLMLPLMTHPSGPSRVPAASFKIPARHLRGASAISALKKRREPADGESREIDNLVLRELGATHFCAIIRTVGATSLRQLTATEWEEFQWKMLQPKLHWSL